MRACQQGFSVPAGMLNCQRVGVELEFRKVGRSAPSGWPADGGGGADSRLGRPQRKLSLSQLSPHLQGPSIASSRVSAASEPPSATPPEMRPYERMLDDVDEQLRERVGVHPEGTDIQPLSREDAELVLAMDRPDLSLPVEFPLEWRLPRRENSARRKFDEVTEEQINEGLSSIHNYGSNASRLRNVEERCNLQVRRGISQDELGAMGVGDWASYSWQQPVELSLAYDRVPEACYIEHGRVRIRPPLAMEGDYCELAAGDFVRFPKYSFFMWEIVEAPVVRRYKFLIDLPPPPDQAEVSRLRLHEKTMHEQQMKTSVKFKAKPMKGWEKAQRLAEAEIQKDLSDLS